MKLPAVFCILFLSIFIVLRQVVVTSQAAHIYNYGDPQRRMPGYNGHSKHVIK